MQRARPATSRLSLYVCRSCRYRLQVSDTVANGRRALTTSASPLRRALLSSSTTINASTQQRRWITRAYLEREREADLAHEAIAKEIEAGARASMLATLEERGLVNQVVGERKNLNNLLNKKRVGVYCGIDPTAPSLHVGHMLPFMTLAWFYVHGYYSVFLLGGSTARFGDPTGRLTSRDTMAPAVRKSNMFSMHLQLKKLGVSIESYGELYGYKRQTSWKRALENNNSWWQKESLLDVMKTMGNGVRVGPMLGRDTVKNRLEKGDGMALSEFLYPVMQAWDWWQLYKQRKVLVQVGGGDQYGNILAGIDAVKHVLKTREDSPEDAVKLTDLNSPIGFTTPLLTTSSGEKFGKSAGNAIWLDKDLTSVFDLYQYFLRTPDVDVERLLKMFTFMPLPSIATLMEIQNRDQSKRIAQHRLALDFCTLIHGKQEAEAAAEEHRQIFQNRQAPSLANLASIPQQSQRLEPSATDGDWSPSLNDKAPQTNWKTTGKNEVVLPKSLVYDQPFHKILWASGLVSSKSEGHRLIANKGAHVASRADGKGGLSDAISWYPIRTALGEETNKFIMEGGLLLLRIGKWKIRTVKVVEDEEFRKLGISVPGWEDGAAAEGAEAKP